MHCSISNEWDFWVWVVRAQLASFFRTLTHSMWNNTTSCRRLEFDIYIITLVRPLSVCLSVCLCVCSQTPPRPLVGLTLFHGGMLISYRGVTLSIFHDLGSKVKVTTEVKVIDFFFRFGKFDELSRKLKIIFSKMSYKFHENLEIFTP